jgi:hypothetical protein
MKTTVTIITMVRMNPLASFVKGVATKQPKQTVAAQPTLARTAMKTENEILS